MYDEMDIDRIRGAVAHDRSGERIGNVGEVYLDDQSGEPMWVTVHTGFFGLRTSFAPLAGSRVEEDGRLVLAHDKEQVKDAPNIDEDGHLDRAQEDELYSYYGVGTTAGAGGVLGEGELRTRRWGNDLVDDRRDDPGLDPHGDRGYAGDTGGDVGLGRDRDVPYDRDRAYDDGPLLDRDRDGRGPIEEVLDGPDDPANPRRT